MPVCDTTKEICDPPTCKNNPEQCPEPCDPKKITEKCPPEVMRASLRAQPRCVGGSGYGRTNAPFNVTVSVSGSAKNVERIEFRRNHYRVRTLTKANRLGKYVLRVDPRRLASNANHEIETRVVLRAPGSFSSRKLMLRKNLRTVRFMPVRRCTPPPPPPPPG